MLFAIFSLQNAAVAEESDDSAYLQALIDSSKPGQQLMLDREYRVSRQIIVPKPVFITGNGTIVASPEILQFIGTRGTDALLRFTKAAEGSVLENLTINLSMQGRTAVRIETPMTVRNVRIENYHKQSKADNVGHSKSESGFRISASGVRMLDIECFNMTTAVDDSVPRCVTIHGDAADVQIDGIEAINVNGGVTVGRSDNVSVTNFRFDGISDNGFYVLPGSSNFLATSGTMRNVSEAAVFKGTDATLRDVEIHNHRLPFGIENASGVTLAGIKVTHDDSLKTRPAFLRTRNGNRRSDNIRVVDIDAHLPQGSSLLNLATGSVTDFRLEQSTFVIDTSGQAGDPWLVRQNQGDPPQLTDNVFEYQGAAARSFRNILIRVPNPCPDYVEALEAANAMRSGEVSMNVAIRRQKR